MKQFIAEQLRKMINEENENNFSSFIQDLNASPVEGKKNIYVADFNNSKIYFKIVNKNTIELDLIQTPEELRGGGNAKNALITFLNIIDKYKLNTELMVSPRDKGTDFKKLVNFYKNFGFIFNSQGGFESDFEMIRYKKR